MSDIQHHLLLQRDPVKFSCFEQTYTFHCMNVIYRIRWLALGVGFLLGFFFLLFKLTYQKMFCCTSPLKSILLQSRKK